MKKAKCTNAHAIIAHVRPLGTVNFSTNEGSVDYGSNADSDDGDLFDVEENFRLNYRFGFKKILKFKKKK